MKSDKRSIILLLITDLIILTICCYGLYLVSQKANLPFTIVSEDSFLIVKNLFVEPLQIEAGDTLISIDNFYFQNWQEIELYIDGKKIGEKVSVTFLRNSYESKTDVTLIEYYTAFDLIIMASVSFLFIGLALFIRIKAGDNKSAEIFHWASVGLGVVVACTAGTYALKPVALGYLTRIFWLFAYNITPVLFIHFTISFINKKIRGSGTALKILYHLAIINSIVLSYLFVDFALDPSYNKVLSYTFYFESVLRIFVLACVICAISICIYAYRQSEDREERRRLLWLLFGFFIGPFSFVVFWILPIIFFGYALLPEFIILILLLAIPVSFGIAIIKYHLLNISFFVNRSVLYSIVLAGLIISFTLISSLLAFVYQRIDPTQQIKTTVPFIISAVLVALLLQPVKKRVQTFVDKHFFRLEYDFREEQKKFLEEIKNVNSVIDLSKNLVERTNDLIPVEKIGFFIVEKPQIRIKLLSQKGFDILAGRSLKFEEEKLKTDLSYPIALDDKVEMGTQIELADIKVFKRWGMVLVLPIKSVSDEIYAFLVLGEKKSRKRFYKDDIDLLNSVTSASALSIDRIKISEQLLLEQLEVEKLMELDKMRRDFIKTMTHELKNPLGNIKLYTELMESDLNNSSAKTKEKTKIILGESDKLQTIIDNILDHARIDMGLKMYEMESVEINSVIEEEIRSSQYQFWIKNQIIESKVCPNNVFILADAKAVMRAVSNLLTNASKYSNKYSKTIINTELTEGFFTINVQDEGRGIHESELANIFNPFVRTQEVISTKIEGTGLGLSIVKHIMDAHNGKIEVKSTLGKGSTFSLIFPVITDEKNINN
jgi:signal transduction histidine kinase